MFDTRSASTTRRPNGFTLVEILIVVVIMAVLAAMVIPQFTTSTDDAKASTLLANLRTMRAQLELYRFHHDGSLPTITASSLPQLTSATNVAGGIGTPGTSFPFGPYLVTGIPENPVNGKATVVEATTVPPAAVVGDAGWLYDTETGRIWANTAEFLSK